LRHVERTKILIHLVDIASENPLGDYETIQTEMAAYGHGLTAKQQILVLNKSDVVSPEDIKAIASQFPETPLVISAATKKGLDTLLQAVWKHLGISE